MRPAAQPLGGAGQIGVRFRRLKGVLLVVRRGDGGKNLDAPHLVRQFLGGQISHLIRAEPGGDEKGALLRLHQRFQEVYLLRD